MKPLKSILFIVFLLIGPSIFAQSVPDQVTRKVKAMQEQITKDLQLTKDQSETYYKAEIERSKLRAEKIKPEMTPEEITEARRQIGGAVYKILATSFSKEMIPTIVKWSGDNEKNFNNIK